MSRSVPTNSLFAVMHRIRGGLHRTDSLNPQSIARRAADPTGRMIEFVPGGTPMSPRQAVAHGRVAPALEQWRQRMRPELARVLPMRAAIAQQQM